MKPIQKTFLIALVATQLVSMSPVYATALAASKPTKEKWFTYKGQVFFNATHSGVQGEKYLLNQQLSNIKLSSDLRLTDWSRIHGLFIYNTSPNPIIPRFYFEQAFLELKKPTLTAWYLNIGKKWLPFGNYKNDLIYKPLTKALGQTNEYTLVLGYDNYYYANVSLFSPHTKLQSSSLPVYYNANIGTHKTNEQYAYDLGASYIYSLADSQLFQFNKGFGGFLGESISSHVPAIATYTNLKYKKFNTYITYVSAIKPFKHSEFSYQNRGAMPSTFSIQNGYAFDVKHIPFKFITFYDRSFQALALRLPEQRLGLGLNMYPHRYVDIQLQYFKDYSYAADTKATGLNKNVSGNSNITNTLALQLVLNF